MCCFSKPVKFVANTSIFARADGDHQLLAYAMRVGASEDLAMVLPLPVPPGSGEDAVRFIDLSAYPTFFEDLSKAFPMLMAQQARGGGDLAASFTPKTLEVHRVGEFEASFVPTVADFDRLDERFRLPAQVWDQLPQYRDWGFAVFKLRAEISALKGLASAVTGGRAFSRDYHPMAFRFPRRDPAAVFFPTVHIHDGEVHKSASFAHSLYLQHDGGVPDAAWLTSLGSLGKYLSVDRAGGLLAPDQVAFQKVLVGELPNRDTFVRSTENR